METVSKKICLLGDFAVGKTSLVRRFVYDLFEDRYLSTIGVKVSRKPVTVASGNRAMEMVMMLWDLAGSEEFNQMRMTYLRGAAGALLVYDLTRPETLSDLSLYVDQLRKVNPAAHFVLAANKADLLAEKRNGDLVAEGQSYAAEIDAPHLLTSALTGLAVEEAFQQLATLLAA